MPVASSARPIAMIGIAASPVNGSSSPSSAVAVSWRAVWVFASSESVVPSADSSSSVCTPFGPLSDCSSPRASSSPGATVLGGTYSSPAALPWPELPWNASVAPVPLMRTPIARIEITASFERMKPPLVVRDPVRPARRRAETRARSSSIGVGSTRAARRRSAVASRSPN
jgi:hypothetical protein